MLGIEQITGLVLSQQDLLEPHGAQPADGDAQAIERGVLVRVRLPRPPDLEEVLPAGRLSGGFDASLDQRREQADQELLSAERDLLAAMTEKQRMTLAELTADLEKLNVEIVALKKIGASGTDPLRELAQAMFNLKEFIYLR